MEVSKENLVVGDQFQLLANKMFEVKELILSQEENGPGTHMSQREIACELGIGVATLHRIVKKKLGLTAFKKKEVQHLSAADNAKRVERGRRLRRMIMFMHGPELRSQKFGVFLGEEISSVCYGLSWCVQIEENVHSLC